jgi:hypothetical protein
MFRKQAGVDTVHVPYKGAGLILPDLISGTVQLAIMSAAATVPQAKAGKVRAIAVTRPVKIAIAPDWPPLADHLPDSGVLQPFHRRAGGARGRVSRLSKHSERRSCPRSATRLRRLKCHAVPSARNARCIRRS